MGLASPSFVSMSVSATPPSFPVIHEAPGPFVSLRHARFSDWVKGSVLAGAMLPVGYLIGRPIRGPVMGFMFVAGSLAGVMFASQNASYRLMGFRENEREVSSLQYRLDRADQVPIVGQQEQHQ